MEYDKFYGTLYKVGDSLVVTIPFNLVKYAGWEVGTEVVVMIKKKV